MRFLIDECCDAIVARTLRELGHDVIEITQVSRGSFDASILSRARSEDRVVVTEDKDFGELILRHGHDSEGCVLLRLPQWDSEFKAARIRELLARHEHRVRGSYVVVSSDKFRIRSLS